MSFNIETAFVVSQDSTIVRQFESNQKTNLYDSTVEEVFHSGVPVTSLVKYSGLDSPVFMRYERVDNTVSCETITEEQAIETPAGVALWAEYNFLFGKTNM